MISWWSSVKAFTQLRAGCTNGDILKKTKTKVEYMTRKKNKKTAFLVAGQLPDVGDQPPAVVPVVHWLHVQHGGLDPGLVLQGATESQPQAETLTSVP